MDIAVFFLFVSFLVFLLVFGVIVFVTRAVETRAAATARAQAEWAEKAAAREEAHQNRVNMSRVEEVAADDDAAAQFYDKVPKHFLYTKQQAATALAMSTGRLNELLRAGKISAVKDGGRVKFTSADLQAYVDSLPSLGGSPAAESERYPGEPPPTVDTT